MCYGCSWQENITSALEFVRRWEAEIRGSCSEDGGHFKDEQSKARNGEKQRWIKDIPTSEEKYVKVQRWGSVACSSSIQSLEYKQDGEGRRGREEVWKSAEGLKCGEGPSVTAQATESSGGMQRGVT